ncbi:hypothetical protein G6F59_016164 [Rhizopus arrhizus]|nr:hypothetical protein G6F59_016164 [Rhizopus arrhizus]
MRARDRDGDGQGRLAAVAVIDGHVDGVGGLLAFLQALDIGCIVVQRVRPLARRVDREGAVRAGAVIADRPGVRVVRVDIGLGQLAACRLRAVFLHCAGGVASDGRPCRRGRRRQSR